MYSKGVEKISFEKTIKQNESMFFLGVQKLKSKKPLIY